MFVPLKFHNNLPMIPCEQKLMAYPFDPERFTKYSLSSLEAKHAPSLFLPLDLGITVDLINPEIYESKTFSEPPVEDSELFREPVKATQSKKLARDYSNTSGYLRKSTLPAGPIAYTNLPARVENKQELDIGAEFDSGTLIPKIMSGFNREEFTHPTKPHLKIDKIFNVFPEEHQICTEFITMVFDEDPDTEDRGNLLKEFADDEDLHLLSLYTEDYKDEEEDSYIYSFVRNYKYSYLNDPNQNDAIFWLNEEEGTAKYCVIENKLQLKKKPVPKAAGNRVLPDRTAEVKYRSEQKSELIVRKDKMLELGFQPESGMETPVLMAMPDDMYTEHKVSNLMNKLFGSDDDSED